MAGEVVTVYSGEQPPKFWDASVFITGPRPRPRPVEATSWWRDAINLLRDQWSVEGRLVVFIPEPRGDLNHESTDIVIDEEIRKLHLADVVMFWCPNDTDIQLTFMSTPSAVWDNSQRMVFGCPSNRTHNRLLLHYANGQAVSIMTTLAETVRAVLDKLGEGAYRRDGECSVPLPIWRTDSFQRWYTSQSTAGNTMLGARQVWTFGVGPDNDFLLYWALHVRMYVAVEDRVKSNEVVISRPDISVVALFKRGATLDDTIMVLVREFRSPASTPDGFVHELPGGSGPGPTDALVQGVSEVTEETGLAIDIKRIRVHGSRQLAATLSAHHAHLFAAEITADELMHLRAEQSQPHGVGDTERTWIEITTFGEIRKNRLVDWATLGMLAEALLAEVFNSRVNRS